MDLLAYGLRPQRPEVIDSSMLKDYVDCPSMFYLRHVLGLRRAVRDLVREAPMDWGTLWHTVMETWNKTFDYEQCLAIIDDAWPSSIVAETDSHGRTPDRMKAIFTDYVKQFTAKDMEDFELLRHEQFFDFFDEQMGFRWCGRIDKVLRRKRNKNIVVVDYKTTSRMGANWFEQHEFGFQLPGYVKAVNSMTTERVEEVMLDVLYTLKGKHEFFRRTLRFTPERLAEWTRNVRMWLSEINYMLDSFLEEPEQWKKNWNECTRFGNCSFTDVHFLPASGDTRLRVLASDYVEDRWSPLQRMAEVES